MKVPVAATVAAATAPASGSTSRVDPNSTQLIDSVPLAPPVDLPIPPPAAPQQWPPAPVAREPYPITTNGHAPVAPPTSSTPAAGGWQDMIPPRWVRFVLWIIAVPLAFIIVFWIARLVGVLSTNNITDVALAEGWSRFWPIARLLPFVALATAGIVHGGAFGIAEFRARRHAKAAGPDPSKPGPARQSSGKAA